MSQMEIMQWLRGMPPACKGIVGGSKGPNVINAYISAQAQAVMWKATRNHPSALCRHKQGHCCPQVLMSPMPKD